VSRDGGRKKVLIAALAGVIVATLATIVFVEALPGSSTHEPATPAVQAGPEDYGTAPSYTLTDQHGRPFSSAALRGRVQVVSYLFPYCTTYCPLAAATLAQTERLADRAGLTGKVAFVAFNVDPEGADHEQLAAFLRQEGIDPDNPAWHYLTGSPAQIRQVVTGGFHIFYQKVSLAEEERTEAEQKASGDYTPQPTLPNALADQAHVDYDIVHNDVIEIVDPNGTIRAIFSSASTATSDQILAAVQDAL
jgi:cytochrome oxidase Cu insertion factor (SCO1/SenC/PrrC family)